ncbi:MAG TPA: YidC/Oxa1 family membrane protein insertase [Candidatus Woesebacteria bacterium]|nr:YidC/Oxa1 family membrane protein insertase [Candidatus Woesebacteria bacterium]HNS94776.1 YidC/Oxa1 family membrane protein insertase [Candidatus Woesebacteria bacterium]
MFDTLIINPFLNALVFFYGVFSSLGTPGAFGFAIIALTGVFRLALHPFFKQQIESQQKMTALRPKMSELEKKHKDDKTRLQQAQLDLYKEHGINPASGCLFALVQLPIFIGLYQTLSRFVDAAGNARAVDAINKVLYSPTLALKALDPYFFGFNLAVAPQTYKIIDVSFSSGIALLPQNLPYAHYMLIPLITGLLQYVQAQKTISAQPAPEKKDATSAGDKKPESFSSDFQSAMNTQIKYFFPIMIAFFSYQLPVGLSLYWNIFSIFSIIQAIRTSQSTLQIAAKK